MSGRYDDIINLPHHVSEHRVHMPQSDRAAQFAPFAALSGYDAAVKETARYTDERTEINEDAAAVIDEKLRLIRDKQEEHPRIFVKYFKEDSKKAGGAYITVSGSVQKLDEYKRLLIMENGVRVNIDDVYDISGNWFER